MASIAFYKVTALPVSPEPNSVYMVKDSDEGYVRLYITSTGGTAFPVQPDEIQDLIVVAGSPNTAAWDLDEGNVATLSTNTDFTLSNPTNIRNGNLYRLLVTNSHAATPYTITFGSDYHKGAYDGVVDQLTSTAILFQAINDKMYLFGVTEGLAI